MNQPPVSRATMGRLPLYLRYLQSIRDHAENTSAAALSRALGLGKVQVRKDLNAVSGAGRPKIGYNTAELIDDIAAYLAADSDSGGVILVGAGKLGRALLDYGGFRDYGLDIDAAFDIAVAEPCESQSGKPIYPMDDLDWYCRTHPPVIGILTVPASAAQNACNTLIAHGVRGIWCFAPCTLSVPDDFPVRYENMALSLAYLRKKI